uniref:DNA pilot protein n=1 Tax=Dulem virus 110 TaxID=3145587 RepID=A0AAU8AV95_9VIRU
MGFFSSIGNAIGGIVGGAANVVGGILGMNSQDKANAAISEANAANLALAREQFEYQKELHKNQMQWRVEDAKKAGLHPMAAIGLQGSSFSPVSSSFTPLQANDYSWIGDLGQSAGYAAMKAKDKDQQREAFALAAKEANLQSQNMELQNEGLQLENEFRRFQLQQAIVGATSQALRSPGSASTRGLGKRYAIDGQADSLIPKDSPITNVIPKYQWVQTADGKLELYPSSDYAQLWEDKPLGTDLMPLMEAGGVSLRAKITGAPVAGMVWDSSTDNWVAVDSPAGRRVLKRSKKPTKESTKRAYQHRFWR